MRKKRFTAILAALVCLLLLWNSRPQRIGAVMDVDPSQLSGMAASCTVGSVKNGAPAHDVYLLNSLDPESEHFRVLLAALESTRYCGSPRDLLPFPRDTVSGGAGYEDCAVNISLGAGENGIHLSFLTPRKLCLNLPEEEGLLVYFLTDKDAFYTLKAYLMEHGQAS